MEQNLSTSNRKKRVHYYYECVICNVLQYLIFKKGIRLLQSTIHENISFRNPYKVILYGCLLLNYNISYIKLIIWIAVYILFILLYRNYIIYWTIIWIFNIQLLKMVRIKFHIQRCHSYFREGRRFRLYIRERNIYIIISLLSKKKKGINVEDC